MTIEVPDLLEAMPHVPQEVINTYNGLSDENKLKLSYLYLMLNGIWDMTHKEDAR